MQQDYADSLGVELGGEFRVAYDYWNRPLYITLTRAWESLRWWGKTKLFVGLLLSTLQKPNPKELQEWMQSILNDDDGGDLLSKSIAELGQHFPQLEQVIIKERDAYMACKLQQTCDHMLGSGQQNHQSNQSQSIQKTYRLVAIVGAGHVEGICHWLTQGAAINDSNSNCNNSSNNTINTDETTTPSQILTRLVQLKKKPIDPQSMDYLVNDIMEVNPELLKEMIQDMQIHANKDDGNSNTDNKNL
ncbi:MAG: hypothetical protein SGARI_002910 [Bacillariaceae sp.]